MYVRERESEPGSLLAGDSSQDGIRKQETAILASWVTVTAPSLPEVCSAGSRAQAKPRGRAVPENMLAGVHGAESWERRDCADSAPGARRGSPGGCN